MARSIIEDPHHVPQKKNKVIKELPNGRLLSKEMQKMSDKGWTQVTDDDIYNILIDLMQTQDSKDGPFLTHGELQLYVVGNCVIIYDNKDGLMHSTKDSPLQELDPEYWNKLASK